MSQFSSALKRTGPLAKTVVTPPNPAAALQVAQQVQAPTSQTFAQTSASDATTLLRRAGVRTQGAMALGQQPIGRIGAPVTTITTATAVDLRPTVDSEAIKQSIQAASLEQKREKIKYEMQFESQKKGVWSTPQPASTTTSAPAASPTPTTTTTTTTTKAATTPTSATATTVTSTTATPDTTREKFGRSLLSPLAASTQDVMQKEPQTPKLEDLPPPKDEEEDKKQSKRFIDRIWEQTEALVNRKPAARNVQTTIPQPEYAAATHSVFNTQANRKELDQQGLIMEKILSDKPYTLSVWKQELETQKAKMDAGQQSLIYSSLNIFRRKSETEISEQQMLDMQLKILNKLSESELHDNEALKELLDDEERLEEISKSIGAETAEVQGYLSLQVQNSNYNAWVQNYRQRFPNGRLPTNLVNLQRLVNVSKGFFPQEEEEEDEYRPLGAPDLLNARQYNEYKFLKKRGSVSSIKEYKKRKEERKPRPVGLFNVARSYERQYA